MTKVTTYTCDRCEKTVENSEDAPGIAVIVQASPHSRSYIPANYTRHWCIPCLKAFNLVPQKEKDKPNPPPTFEQLIEELVEGMVEEKMDQ